MRAASELRLCADVAGALLRRRTLQRDNALMDLGEARQQAAQLAAEVEALRIERDALRAAMTEGACARRCAVNRVRTLRRAAIVAWLWLATLVALPVAYAVLASPVMCGAIACAVFKVGALAFLASVAACLLVSAARRG